MRLRISALVAVLPFLCCAQFAAAQVIDGTLDAIYGAPIVTQTVQTQFGDSTGGVTTGGELDAAYATVSGGRLNVLITGNVENNFNNCLLYTSPSPRDATLSRMPSSA